MKSIKIAGKKFKLASRLTRLYALFIDIALLGCRAISFRNAFIACSSPVSRTSRYLQTLPNHRFC